MHAIEIIKVLNNPELRKPITKETQERKALAKRKELLKRWQSTVVVSSHAHAKGVYCPFCDSKGDK
jgi:hypothetical protein